MKLKEAVHLLGFRPAPKRYGFEIRRFDLPKDGRVEYAQWLHPRETTKTITQESIDELRRFLKPGDVCIDIGAHTGDSTIPIALAVGPTGCVLALEPNPFVFPVLDKNAQLNAEKTRIVPLMFAATPEDGRCDFEYSDSGFCNGGRHAGISKWRHGHAFPLTVEGRNLPSYLNTHHPQLLSKLAYIKVDAEGYDLTILTTLAGLISRYRPYIKAEVYAHADRPQREQLFRFFTDQRYVVHKVESESNYRGPRIGVADLMTWRHFDVFCISEEEQT
jgi:FkbM family methyltransferase